MNNPGDDPDQKVVEEIQNRLQKVQKEKVVDDPSVSLTKSQKIGNPDWKSETEVKEYLENLYVEYSFQCLNENQPAGCHRLANFLENIRGQFKEATSLYKKNCDEYKYGPSCLTYAKNKSLGRGCTKNLLEACTYSFLACDEHKLTEGCLNSGICLSEGVGGATVNVQESVGYFEKACEDKNPYACLKLFKIFIEGTGNVKRDPVKAFDYTKKACDANDMLGCLNASLMLRKGDGIEKDLKQSEAFREKADELRKELDSSRERRGVVFGEQHK